MPKIIVRYVRFIDAFNRRLGRMIMYLIFVMIGVLMFSTISKSFFLPSLWTLEVAQFLMVAYFLLGGAYSMQLNAARACACLPLGRRIRARPGRRRP